MSSKASSSRPTKRIKLAPTKAVPKPSNRPNYQQSSSEDESEDESERAEMLFALEQHQSSLLGIKTKGKSKEVAIPVKSIWEMDENDFNAEETQSEDDSEEDSVTPASQSLSQSSDSANEIPAVIKAKLIKTGPTIISFSEPRATSIGTNKDMRNFMSSKVKNSRPTFSVADEINLVKKGKERKSSALDNTEEEAHLATLDSTLSDMIRPLTAPTTSSTHSQLPTLLLALPTAPTKLLKGLTPLPVNAPRTLRRGQSAKNLTRAQGRDEANGLIAGSKGREAKSLGEKRKAEGTDGRERGMNSSFGKMRGGGIFLSRDEISLGSGESGNSSRGGKGGRGGRGGRGGGTVRSQGGGKGRLERK